MELPVVSSYWPTHEASLLVLFANSANMFPTPIWMFRVHFLSLVINTGAYQKGIGCLRFYK